MNFNAKFVKLRRSSKFAKVQRCVNYIIIVVKIMYKISRSQKRVNVLIRSTKVIYVDYIKNDFYVPYENI